MYDLHEQHVHAEKLPDEYRQDLYFYTYYSHHKIWIFPSKYDISPDLNKGVLRILKTTDFYPILLIVLTKM